MRCPSCGASYEESDCNECGTVAPSATALGLKQTEPGGFESITESTHSLNQNGRSTLIEFPGVVRSTVPEWRRELSERVREVQERRAREAELEAEEAERRRLAEEAAAQAPQLELLQQANAPPMNPLVAAALRRIERANQAASASPPPRAQTAAAIAYVSEQQSEDSRSELSTPSDNVTREETAAERAHNLIVVPSPANTRTPKAESRIPTKRLISENDPSLNYLDTIPNTLRLDEIHERRAGIVPRAVSSAIDLVVSAILFSPFASAIELTNADWHSSETLAFAAGVGIFVAFLYLTSTIALTGRTLGMRLLYLRTVDRRTGMLPTGTQAAGRAFVYLLSLLMLGLPTIYSLLDKDGYTAPDKLTGTVVVRC